MDRQGTGEPRGVVSYNGGTGLRDPGGGGWSARNTNFSRNNNLDGRGCTFLAMGGPRRRDNPLKHRDILYPRPKCLFIPESVSSFSCSRDTVFDLLVEGEGDGLTASVNRPQ